MKLLTGEQMMFGCFLSFVQPRTPQGSKPSGLAAVEVAHPGASYNPTFEDHQDLLQKALDTEKKQEKEELKLHRALDMQFPKAHQAPTEVLLQQETPHQTGD